MSKLIRVDKYQKIALAIATAFALLVSIIFLKGYLLLIIVAAIVAFLFNPIYQKLINKGKSPSTAASITLVVTFISLIVPLTFLIIITSYEVASLVDQIEESAKSYNIGELGQQVIDFINNFLKNIGISYQVTTQAVSSALSSAVEGVGGNLVKNVWSSINGIFGFITIAIIYIYVFMSLLKNQKAIIRIVHQINPLGKQIGELYVERMGSMTKAMVRGQFIIAAMQGTTDAVLLYLGGIHTAFFFFVVILIALSIIPLGGGILVLPIGVIMLLTGNIVGGLIVILGHLFIVTNIDNIMRPRLVPEEARLDPALTLLAVFSGVAMFGFIGIVLGPVLMIVLVTTLQVYLEVFKGEDAVKEASSKKNTPLLQKFKKTFNRNPS